MKKILGSAVLAIAALAAAPALANQGGVPNGGAGVAGISASGAAAQLSFDSSNKTNLQITDTIAGSSGSGFSASFNIQPNSVAAFQGGGVAGTLTTLNGGTVASVSGSLGAFNGSTIGNASVSADAMNFAQSNVERTFDLSVKTTQDVSFDAGAFELNAIGGFAAFGF